MGSCSFHVHPSSDRRRPVKALFLIFLFLLLPPPSPSFSAQLLVWLLRPRYVSRFAGSAELLINVEVGKRKGHGLGRLS